MTRAVRPLLFVLTALALFASGVASAHTHTDGPDLDQSPCAICHLVADTDDVVPPMTGEADAGPVTQSTVRAFLARTAIVPPTTIVPPGRAPPATR